MKNKKSTVEVKNSTDKKLQAEADYLEVVTSNIHLKNCKPLHRYKIIEYTSSKKYFFKIVIDKKLPSNIFETVKKKLEKFNILLEKIDIKNYDKIDKKEVKNDTKTDLILKQGNYFMNEKNIVTDKQIDLKNKKIVVYDEDKNRVDSLLPATLKCDSYYINCMSNLSNLMLNNQIRYSYFEDNITVKLDRKKIKEVFQIEGLHFQASKVFDKFSNTKIKYLVKEKEVDTYGMIILKPFFIQEIKMKGTIKNLKNKIEADSIQGYDYIKIYFDSRVFKSFFQGKNYFHMIKDFYKILFESLIKEPGLADSEYTKIESDIIYKIFFNFYFYYNEAKMKRSHKIKEDLKNGIVRIDKDKIFEFIKNSNFNYRKDLNKKDFYNIDSKELLKIDSKKDYFLNEINQKIDIGNKIYYKNLKKKKETHPERLPLLLSKTTIQDKNLMFRFKILDKKQIENYNF